MTIFVVERNNIFLKLGNYKKFRLENLLNIICSVHLSSQFQAASQMGLTNLPSVLTEDLAENSVFLRALYHVLMNVHLVRGILKCSNTGREFPVTDGIVNFMLEEDECEHVRL